MRALHLVVAVLLLLASVPLAASAATPPTLRDGSPAPVWAEWEWADADEATIHPGVWHNNRSCTANFVFTRVDDDGFLVDVLIGTAAHCVSVTSGANECTDEADPIDSLVDVDGATMPALHAYNATTTMQAVGEDDTGPCFGNDFAMLSLHPADWSRVNPSIPDHGGPVGVNETGTMAGDALYSWGNSALRQGIEVLSPKRGVAIETNEKGWNHLHYAITPGIFGDSGSPFLDADGNALGYLSTIALVPFPASNNANDLFRAMVYARTHDPRMAGLDLALGTEPWAPIYP